MKKRVLSLLLCAALLAGSLTGCDRTAETEETVPDAPESAAENVQTETEEDLPPEPDDGILRSNTTAALSAEEIPVRNAAVMDFTGNRCGSVWNRCTMESGGRLTFCWKRIGPVAKAPAELSEYSSFCAQRYSFVSEAFSALVWPESNDAGESLHLLTTADMGESWTEHTYAIHPDSFYNRPTAMCSVEAGKPYFLSDRVGYLAVRFQEIVQASELCTDNMTCIRLYKTEDAGQTFVPVALFSADSDDKTEDFLPEMLFAFTDEMTGYTAIGSVLYKTEDGGVTWNEALDMRTVLPADPEGYSVQVRGMVFDGMGGGTVHLYVSDRNHTILYVLTTDDNGENWVAERSEENIPTVNSMVPSDALRRTFPMEPVPEENAYGLNTALAAETGNIDRIADEDWIEAMAERGATVHSAYPWSYEKLLSWPDPGSGYTRCALLKIDHSTDRLVWMDPFVWEELLGMEYLPEEDRFLLTCQNGYGTYTLHGVWDTCDLYTWTENEQYFPDENGRISLTTAQLDDFFEQLNEEAGSPEQILQVHITDLSVPVILYTAAYGGNNPTLLAVEAYGKTVTAPENTLLYGNLRANLYEAEDVIVMESLYYHMGTTILLQESGAAVLKDDPALENGLSFYRDKNGRLCWYGFSKKLDTIRNQCCLLCSVSSREDYLESWGYAAMENGSLILSDPMESFSVSDVYDLDSEFAELYADVYESLDAFFAAKNALS